MVKVRYVPVAGGAFAPTLEPGQVIEVSSGEAEHLLSTGAFQRVVDGVEASGVGEPPARPRKGRD